MAGAAPEVGQQILAGILTPILGALTGGTPAREATPVAPGIARPQLIMGLPITTVVLLAIGAVVLFKVAT